MKAFVFPGQGSQRVGMGESLFDQFPEFVEKADSILGYSIRELCLKDERKQLGQTQYTQPALYTVNALSWLQKVNESQDKPNYLAGHSLGEYNALFAAGVFDFETGLELVRQRGLLMSQAKKGTMVAVMGMAADELESCLQKNGLDTIDVANFNSPAQTVISGLETDMEQAQKVLEDAGAMYIPLATSGAFHSRYMEEAKVEFEKTLAGFDFRAPEIPVVSNVYAYPYDENSIVENLSKQITHPVRWTDCMYYLLDQGVEKVVEIGNGDVLTKMQGYIEKAWSARPKTETQADTDNGPAAMVSHWNNQYPVGTPVKVRDLETEQSTRTPALLLFGHRPAIYLNGFNGYFELDEVNPVGETA